MAVDLEGRYQHHAPHSRRSVAVILAGCILLADAGSYIPSTDRCFGADDKKFGRIPTHDTPRRGGATSSSCRLDVLQTASCSNRCYAWELPSYRRDDQDSTLDSASQSSTWSERLKKSKRSTSRMRIVRLGAKPYHPEASVPRGSNNYTTRKDSHVLILVSTHGIAGDYNHYRSMALRNTTDRAVSIVTRSTLEYVRASGYPIRPGDLGENVLVDAAFNDGGDGSNLIGALRPGTMLQVVGATPSSGAVMLQISEPMVPCANLCTLPYIQNPEGDVGTATPRQRVEACQDLLQLLDAHVGLRGWYARVLQPGELRVGDHFELGEP